jgi:lipopolysaccharide transport system permease protein
MGIVSAENQPAQLPARGWLWRLSELAEYRGLIHNLVLRELKARYKNSVLGFFWSLLNPLAMMLVFTAVFTFMMPNNQIPMYPIYILCGLLPWNFFSAGVMTSVGSIVGNSGLVKKVYFPREVLPIAGVLAQLVNFLLALVVLFAALIIFQGRFSPWLWMLPIVIFMQTCFILGLALILSTLNVFYRDTAMVMDVVMLAWFFLTPVFYPLEILPREYELFGIIWDVHRLMYILNPMASIINTYRDLLYWGVYTQVDFFLRTAATSGAVLVFGYWFFVRYRGRFGEEL